MSVVRFGLNQDVVLNTGLDAKASQLHEIARSLSTFCHSERMNRPAQEKDIRSLNQLLSQLENAATHVESSPELRGSPGHRALVRALEKNGGLLEAYVNHRVAPWMKHFTDENHGRSTFGKLKNAPALLSMKKTLERIKNLDHTAGTILGAGESAPAGSLKTTRLPDVDLDAFLAATPQFSVSHPSSPLSPSMAALFQPAVDPAVMTPSLDPRLMSALREALAMLPAASPLALAIHNVLGPVAALQGDGSLPSAFVDPVYYAGLLGQPIRGSKGRGAPASYREAQQEIAARIRAGEAGPVYATVNAELEQRIRAGMEQHRSGGEYLKVRALIDPTAQSLGGGYWGAEGSIRLTAAPDSMAYIGDRGPYPLSALQSIEIIDEGSKSGGGNRVRSPRVTVPDHAAAGKVTHAGPPQISRDKIPQAAHQRAAELGWKLEPTKPGMSRRKDAVGEGGRFPPEWDDISIDRKIKLANSICMALEGDSAVVREFQTVRVRRFLFPETWDEPAQKGRPKIRPPAEEDAAWAERMRAQDQQARKHGTSPAQ
ncbi:MAG: hypothetical protein IT384_26515 [Deltaproteobacteria bacterium]|nr:hypothetical protein [Deltaproteobacteria bacterium]